MYAARRQIAGDRHGGVGASLPGLPQGVPEQRKHPGPAAGEGRVRAARGGGGCVGGSQVAQQQLGQARFQRAPRLPGRTDDALPQLVDGHRTECEQPVADDGNQRRVLQAASGDVGAYPQYDAERALGRPGFVVAAGQGHEGRDVGPAFGLVVAEGEDLLELVDDDDTGAGAVACLPGGGGDAVGGPGAQDGHQLVRPFGGRAVVVQVVEQAGGQCGAQRLTEGGQRTRRRGAHDHRGARRTVGESGDETRPQQRGLARPGERDDGHRPLAVPLGESLHEHGDRPLPAEEPPDVTRAEGGQPGIGAVLVVARHRLPLPQGRRQQDEERAVGVQGLVAQPRDIAVGRLPARLDLAEIALAVVRDPRQVRQRQAALQAQFTKGGAEGRVLWPPSSSGRRTRGPAVLVVHEWGSPGANGARSTVSCAEWSGRRPYVWGMVSPGQGRGICDMAGSDEGHMACWASGRRRATAGASGTAPVHEPPRGPCTGAVDTKVNR